MQLASQRARGQHAEFKLLAVRKVDVEPVGHVRLRLFRLLETLGYPVEGYKLFIFTVTAVIAGIAGTARVITSAALIMISVFGGFVLGDDPVIKMMGLGLAVAILVVQPKVRDYRTIISLRVISSPRATARRR